MKHAYLLSFVVAALLEVVVGGRTPCQAQTTTRAAPIATSRAASSAETRVKLGEALLLARRYDEAIVEFGKVLAVEPTNRRARLGLGRAYFWSGRVDDAAKTIQPLIVDNPDEETKELWRDVLAASGSVAAVQAVRQAIEKNPTDPALQQSQAALLVGLGCFAPAIQGYRELVDKFPGNGEIGVDLGLAYFTADRYPEAIDVCRRYAEDRSPTGRRARIVLARSLLKAWRIAEANEVLEGIRKQDTGEPRAELGLLTTWVLDPKSSPVTVAQCLEALSASGARSQLQERADVREWLFSFIGELVSHVKTDERADLAKSFASLLAAENETPATKLCRQVLEQYAKDGPSGVKPDVEELCQAVSRGEVSRTDLLEAGNVLLTLFAGKPLVELCDAALARTPDDALVMLLRAEGLAITAKYKDAEDAYKKILEVLPECTKAQRGLARTYSWHREFKKAEDTYKELVERDPGDMVIRREAARSLGWDKQLKLSLDSYDKSAEMLGEAMAEQTWRDRVERERKSKRASWWVRDREAVKQYKELIEREPSNQEARFDLAQVYARNRMWEEAAAEYIDILNIDARHRRARDALYKNAIYHQPEATVRFDWTKQFGFGDLLDIATGRITEAVKQEVARRTDLSFISSQMWHRFTKWGGGGIDEQDYRFRLDHRFNMNTWGHASSGWAMFNKSDEPERWIADAALSHKLTDWLVLTGGWERQPWRQNKATIQEAIDQNRLFIGGFSNVDPWLDLWLEYAHSWLNGGKFQLPPVPGTTRPQPPIITPENEFDELNWGAAYRFSLFPKILQFEYRGFAWWFDKQVPTYYSPNPFEVNLFRLAWRHYLNNDQYVEQKQLYYEVGVTWSMDSQGIGGVGYDAGAGWDICHYFGVEGHWSSTFSKTYNANALFVQIVMRF